MAQLEKRYEEYLRDESRLTGYAESILQAKSAQEVLDFLKTESPFTVQGARTGIVGRELCPGGRILNLSSMQPHHRPVRQGRRFLCHGGAGGSAVRTWTTLWPRSGLTPPLGRTLQGGLAALAKAPPQFFPPDPTESTATLGGMFAANAAASAPTATAVRPTMSRPSP